MLTCPNRGGENPGGAAFCGMCGASIAPASSSPAPAGPSLEWIRSFPLATSRLMLYDIGKVLVWAGVIVLCIGTAIALAQGAADSPASECLQVVGIFSLVLAGLGLLFLLVMLVFFGNRFRAWFSIGPGGYGFEVRSSRARWSSRAAMAAGVLGGSPGAAGAGMIAYSQESDFTPWSEVRRIKLHPRLCVISVMNGWRVLLRLYCTPENYPAACRLVRHYAPSAGVEGSMP